MMNEADVLSDLDQLRSRYDVLRRLGHDGAFIVYGVRSPGSDRHFAVKVMDNPGSRGAKAGTLHGWQAHTMKQLEHPGLVVLHAVHHLQGGAVALAMERRRGRTLAKLIDDSGPLPIAEVERVLREIAGALAYLHGRGVVHRGVRPHSIFLDRDSGRARLAHFGIDGGGDDAGGTAGHGAVLGTFAYLAPEQIDGQTQVDGRRLSARSDLYSLGLVGYAMLTGKQPWEGESLDTLVAERKSAALPPLADLRPDAPAHLCEAIERCLEKNPGRRWRSVEEFLARLDPTAEITRAGPAMAWDGLRRRVEDGVATCRKGLEERLSATKHGRLALAVSVGVIALIVLSSLRGSEDPIARGAEDRPTATTSARETAPPEFGGIPGQRSADATLPGVLAGPPVSTLEDAAVGDADGASQAPQSGASTAANQRSPAAPPPSGRPAGAGNAADAGGLVLLGDPVIRQPPPTLLGESARTGDPTP